MDLDDPRNEISPAAYQWTSRLFDLLQVLAVNSHAIGHGGGDTRLYLFAGPRQ